jgi:hypothetical protein
MSAGHPTPMPTIPLHKMLNRMEWTPNCALVTACSELPEIYTTIYIFGKSFQRYEVLSFLYMYRQASHDA